MPAMTSSQSVTFRHGSNVEFSESGFPGASAPGAGDVAPIEGYNLQTVNANKARDFANPMYDAVQSGTTADPGMGNGSGESISFKFLCVFIFLRMGDGIPYQRHNSYNICNFVHFFPNNG